MSEVIRIRKGLDINLEGKADETLHESGKIPVLCTKAHRFYRYPAQTRCKDLVIG